MAFPDIADTINLLGYRMRDKITGLSGVVTSVSFDLYGCVQAVLHPGLDKDGKVGDQHWFDVARLVRVGDEQVMIPPAFSDAPAASYDKGPAEKPQHRAS